MGEAPARINLELCSGMARDFYREVGSHPMDEPISYVRADIVDELREAIWHEIELMTNNLGMILPADYGIVKRLKAALAKSEGGA